MEKKLNLESESKRPHLSPISINKNLSNVTLRSEALGTKGHRRSLSLTTIDTCNLAPKLNNHLTLKLNDNNKYNNKFNNKLSYDDRFINKPINDIPSARAAIDGQYAAADAFLDSEIANMRENAVENFNTLRAAVSEHEVDKCRVLAFGESAPKSSEAAAAQSVNFIRACAAKPRWKVRRFVPTMPERVLDAPELVNDYYLNIIHWGSLSGLAIGLGGAVFILNTASGKISKINAFNNNNINNNNIYNNINNNDLNNNDDYVTSVQWAGISSGACLAVGYGGGRVRLFDTTTGKLLRTLSDYADRIPALAWNENILSCGTRRGVIYNYDVRVEKARISVLSAHTQEVCGLAWAVGGTYLASGGNDNDVCVWDKFGAISDGPLLHRFVSHRAAVKAVAWHPRQNNILATGGGLADHTLNFWNVSNGSHLNSLPTNSQISGVVWNPRCDEFVTSHGHPQNQLTLWTYPAMEIGANLVSHTDRVLGLTLSPDGTTVASIGADETVRIWKCFENQPKSSSSQDVQQKPTQFTFN